MHPLGEDQSVRRSFETDRERAFPPTPAHAETATRDGVRRALIAAALAIALIVGLLAIFFFSPRSDAAEWQPAPSVKPFLIGNDPGGEGDDYILMFRRLQASGIPVIIDGLCKSACTIVLSLPPEQVCATPTGRFGFHDIEDDDRGRERVNRQLTLQIARRLYPPKVFELFKTLKFNKHNDTIDVPALRLVRPCG